MKVSVMSHGLLIGTTNIGPGDESMGVLYGNFQPSDGYEQVKHVFRLFSEASMGPRNEEAAKNARYFEGRDALGLTMKTEQGVCLPLKAIHIVDWSVEGLGYEIVGFTEDFQDYQHCTSLLEPDHKPDSDGRGQ